MPRTPRTEAQATALLERHAALSAELAIVEGERAGTIAAVNAAADGRALPILAEQAAIVAALAPWWTVAGPGLTGAKRRSIELGGCTIGRVRSRATLAVPDDAEAVLAHMRTLRWTKPYLRTTVAIDRSAVKACLDIDGRHAAGLAALGFAIVPGADNFFVRPVVAGAGDTVAR